MINPTVINFTSASLLSRVGSGGPEKSDIQNPNLNTNNGETPGDILLELKERESMVDEFTFLKEDMYTSPAYALDKTKAFKERNVALRQLVSSKYIPEARRIIGEPRTHKIQQRVVKKNAFMSRLKEARN